MQSVEKLLIKNNYMKVHTDESIKAGYFKRNGLLFSTFIFVVTLRFYQYLKLEF